jgi:hypothetical protein
VNKIPQIAHGVDRHGQPEEFGGFDGVEKEVSQIVQRAPVFLIVHRATRPEASGRAPAASAEAGKAGRVPGRGLFIIVSLFVSIPCARLEG